MLSEIDLKFTGRFLNSFAVCSPSNPFKTVKEPLRVIVHSLAAIQQPQQPFSSSSRDAQQRQQQRNTTTLRCQPASCSTQSACQTSDSHKVLEPRLLDAAESHPARWRCCLRQQLQAHQGSQGPFEGLEAADQRCRRGTGGEDHWSVCP